MGVRILSNAEDTQACLYCSTTDWAFGPMFNDSRDGKGETYRYRTASENAEAFCDWLGTDVRRFTEHELESKYSDWLGKDRPWPTDEERKRREAEEDG